MNWNLEIQDLLIVHVDHLLDIVKETTNLKHLYGNELDKAYFAHDAAYSDSQDLGNKTPTGKILKHRAYEIARTPNYDDCEIKLASMGYNFF